MTIAEQFIQHGREQAEKEAAEALRQAEIEAKQLKQLLQKEQKH